MNAPQSYLILNGYFDNQIAPFFNPWFKELPRIYYFKAGDILLAKVGEVLTVSIESNISLPGNASATWNIMNAFGYTILTEQAATVSGDIVSALVTVPDDHGTYFVNFTVTAGDGQILKASVSLYVS